MRVKVLLICSECLSRNYVTTIRKDSTEKLELKKFCKHCNKQTLHKISK
ncbi:MAG: 50S ribosomal protein L33 [Bacilli bacterium]|nr:50S ribosomal protein L33 [Bacilli bacterium]